jgi:hypothetical protein
MFSVRHIPILLILSIPLIAQAPVSDKFPVAIRVTAVRMEKSVDIRTSHTGKVFGDDDIWNVITCEINGHTYGLKGHRLELGWYAGRETRNGYDIEFADHGKRKTRMYRIVEEQ